MRTPFTFALLTFLVSTPFARAEVIDAQVVRVDAPEGDGIHLVYLDSGRVLRVRDSNLAESLEGARIAGERIRATVSEIAGHDEVDSVGRSEIAPVTAAIEAPALAEYAPTQLPDLETATRLHKTLITATLSDSICANRAHIWSYRMWRDHGVYSMKAFLFFTPRYIRNYRGKWWYHVTPYLIAGGADYATDRTFFKQPMPVAAWASHFVGNRFQCPEISKYSDYVSQKQTGYCFVRKVPGSVRWPAEVMKMDKGHVPAAGFNVNDVRSAVREALTRKARRNFTY